MVRSFADRSLYRPGFRPDTIIITNLGQGQAIDGMLEKGAAMHYLTTNGLVACYTVNGH